MKNFWKTLLAVICGILIVNLLGIFIWSTFLSSALSPQSAPIPSSGVLKLDLSKLTIAEQGSANLNINESSRTTIGIRKVTEALAIAAVDPGVKCLYLKTDGASIGIGNIQELRRALEAFRSSGKAIVAYMENPTTGTLYLASAADKVYMSSYQGGNPLFTGVSTQLIFLGDALERLGIKVQLIRHGKYKSAGEMYIRSSSSAENRQQNQEMVDSMWETMAAEIAGSRGLEKEDLDFAIDNLRLCMPVDFVEYGLVDELLDRNALENKLAVLAQVEDFSQLSMIPFADYADSKSRNNFRSSKRLAIVYANGQVVDGYDPQNLDGDRFASIFEDLRRDSTVKAVVLRVNSPGGSVVASEKIRNELDLLCEVKPVIASFGDYAASGGYWISSGANKIYANATTLTGSIGVFGMIPDLSSLYKDKLHIGVETVSSNKHADMYSLNRPLSSEELAYIQRSIESIYTKFLAIVASGRDMTPAEVDEIAQGRVWTGADALEIGLVDELGTLDDALRYAALAAGDAQISNWNIVEYPAEKSLIDQLSEMFSNNTPDFSVYSKWFDNWLQGKHEYTFAALPFVPVFN